jgi:Cytochrome c554 and c-prime
MVWNVRMFCGVSAPMARLIALLALVVGCRSEAREVVVPLVATAEVKGTTEPCGCTSDPLGDVARTVTLAQGGLLVDAGRLLYDSEVPAEKKAQADAKARALTNIYQDAGRIDSPPRVFTVSGVRIGVFGVTSPDIAAAKAAMEKLARPQVVVALLGMPRAAARDLLKQLDGVWFGVVGADVDDGMPEPEPVGNAWLVAPADQGRRVVRIELHVKNGRPERVLFGGEGQRKLQLERTKKRIETLTLQLDDWKKDVTADKAFIEARENERAELKEELRRLETTQPSPPPGSYFTYTLVPVRRTLARDPSTAKLLKQLDKEIGAANFAASQHETPPPPGPGDGPRYVGVEACRKCHKPAVEFWKQTVHAHAWKTLVDADKQYNYDCTGCHVTGLGKPGGPTLATAEKAGLVDVQCETCHGPGSKHVEEAGGSIIAKPAERFCADNCHTPQHSDTFQLAPYLRDILGKGHGEKARAALGEGATGHELRQKALGAAH